VGCFVTFDSVSVVLFLHAAFVAPAIQTLSDFLTIPAVF
jgi:hypothetical protein